MLNMHKYDIIHARCHYLVITQQRNQKCSTPACDERLFYRLLGRMVVVDNDVDTVAAFAHLTPRGIIAPYFLAVGRSALRHSRWGRTAALHHLERLYRTVVEGPLADGTSTTVHCSSMMTAGYM